MSSTPRVGVGVIVLRDGLVLLGQRLGSHGAGSWALPGGHLEHGETPEHCSRREVLEETGLEINTLRRGPYTSDVIEPQGLHYVTLFLLAHGAVGEPRRCEPAKCAGWAWHRWSALPQPLFTPLASLCASGYIPQSAA